MKTKNLRRPSPPRSRRAFTLVELSIAGFLSTLGAVMIATMMMMIGNMHKSIFWQQQSLFNAKSAIEAINREIRLATVPLTIIGDGGAAGVNGNEVRFSRAGDATVRAFRLVSPDGDMTTPWDNILVFDPDVAAEDNEIQVARRIYPLNVAGAFSNTGATTPLTVQMRVGDPVNATEAVAAEANKFTGKGVQGFEINITVGPRN